MKKRLLSILLIAVLLLAGCGADAPAPPAETAADANVCGTYIGVGGCALVLREDGAADFYEAHVEPLHDAAWRVEDGTLYVEVPEPYNYAVHAALPEGGASLLLLCGDDDAWHDEYYIRLSDDTSQRTGEEYRALIEQTLNRKLSRELTLGERTVRVPLYYLQFEQNVNLDAGTSAYHFADRSFVEKKSVVGAAMTVACTAPLAAGFNEENAAEKLDELIAGVIADAAEKVVSLTVEDRDGILIRKKVVTVETTDSEATEYAAYDGSGVYVFWLHQTPAADHTYTESFEAMVAEALQSGEETAAAQ